MRWQSATAAAAAACIATGRNAEPTAPRTICAKERWAVGANRSCARDVACATTWCDDVRAWCVVRPGLDNGMVVVWRFAGHIAHWAMKKSNCDRFEYSQLPS